MNENFEKFKKKVWIDILIKCVLAALAAGFAAVAAVLLPCKLYGINLLWVFYVLIAVGGAAAGGGIAFLILRTNDKKISMRLDAELGLEERVQSAYVFAGSGGDMVEMLKGDASAALDKYPARALPFKNIIATALCGVVAVAGLVSLPVITYAVPSVSAQVVQPDGSNSEPPYTPDNWKWEALNELIKYVTDSTKMDSTAKNGTLQALNGLRNVLLSGGVTQTSLRMFVQNAANSISNCVRDANAQYPAEDARAIANTEEETYVITRLYDIFDLLRGGDDDPVPGGKNEEEENGGDNNGGGTSSSGILNENETPFFDKEKGQVTCGSVRTEYLEYVQAMLEQGVISPEEWNDLVNQYFTDLGKINNND